MKTSKSLEYWENFLKDAQGFRLPQYRGMCAAILSDLYDQGIEYCYLSTEAKFPAVQMVGGQKLAIDVWHDSDGYHAGVVDADRHRFRVINADKPTPLKFRSFQDYNDSLTALRD